MTDRAHQIEFGKLDRSPPTSRPPAIARILYLRKAFRACQSVVGSANVDNAYAHEYDQVMSTKTARVIILMSPDDKAALFELAGERGESVGATIRALVEAERARRPKSKRTKK
jgi:hypothetical protein